MALITKNGQIHLIPTKTGKQKGLITKNGQISTLIPYLPADVVVEEETGDDYGHIVMGVAVANIAKVNGVATANISKVIGV
jgi:hypothetical protein